MQKQSKIKLESHIQVLRCLSVFLVLFYHLEISIFEKGYLGVDIFFVISGYVITLRLYQDYKINNKIFLIDFWERRIKRIYPVLILVFSSTFIFYLIFGPSYLIKGIFDQYISSIFAYSNLYFLYQNIDYFNDLSSSPFLHAWSLSVEEQFYLFYPIILIFLFKIYKSQNVFLFNLTIFFIFFLMIYGSFLNEKDNPQFSFYFPIFRFWEIGFGCLVFFINFGKNKLFLKLLYYFSISSLILLVFFDTINSYTVNNLLVVICVSIVIKLYSKNYKTTFLFENNYLVYLGNLSYSIYLWHLPVIYFVDLYFGDSNLIILSIFITIILSILSYNLVENRFRYKKFKFKKITNFKLIPIFVIFLFIFSIIIYQSKYSLSLISTLTKKINFLEVKKNYSSRTNFYLMKIGKYKVYDHCLENSKNFEINNLMLRSECLKINDNNKLFFFIGNSHTANFIPLANKSDEILNMYFLHKSDAFNNENSKLINQQITNFNEIIFVTSVFNLKEFNKLLRFSKKLDSKIKILILGPIPNVNTFDPLKCLIRNKECYIDSEVDIKTRNLSLLIDKINKFSKENEKIKLFLPYFYLCNNINSKRCTIYDKVRDVLTHRDGSHLTYEGSLLLLKPFNDFIKKNY